MIRTARKTLLIAALTLTSCSPQAIPAATPNINSQTLRIYSTPAVAPLTKALAVAYTDTYPGYVIDIQTHNYNTLLQQATHTENSFFVTNHLPVDSPLWAAPIGQDGIAVITHRDNPFQALTSAQIRNIYQGNTQNWRQYGGADEPIQVITREDGSATGYEFKRLMMGRRSITSSALIVPSNTAMLQLVEANRGNIGYVSLGALTPDVLALAVDGIHPTQDNIRNNTYPLRSTLFIVGPAEPQADYRAFIGWVQAEAGQQVIAQHYIPMLIP